MTQLNRRTLVTGLIASSALTTHLASAASQAGQTAPPAAPAPQPKFDFDDVLRRAKDLASAPFDAAIAPLPEALSKLDFDAWRDIRFRPDKAFLNSPGSQFRLQLFHLGHLYKRPVTINTIRDGIPTPIPFTTSLFDYGRTKPEKPIPVNLGFAGFRLHYPLNSPRVYDEVIAFLGASYFRFLGRDQHYGISARALAIGAGGEEEEFPFFREFWIDSPEANADRITIFGLLDSPSTTGAYRFDLYPGVETAMEVSTVLYPRKAGVRFGLAPLTSMFFLGENDRRFNEDFRPELHDSDGLLVHSATGEWIWRPLRNPTKPVISSFFDRDVRGFGLLQRDREFDHYQDLDLAYERRPSYFVEPRESWGEGHVDLVELPTEHEANDNIVAFFTPKDSPEANKPFSYAYRLVASLNLTRLSPNGRALNTYHTTAAALGSAEAPAPGTRRFIIDFTGGDLPFYAMDPGSVEIVPSTSQGKIVRSFLVPNPHVRGFRAAFDVQLDGGQSADLRAFLRRGSQALTETWTYPWRPD
ncbi:glucan biosynthesis protein [Methylocella silvestris]|uniref:Glucan biosynthesis protein G n=1 Tax=Methylocella silvestris TaxID=199596 RepID=A0A2J7TGG4_METSI|nr:glucan biosynthesis protein G [Methylocella silvestris]PNG25860.1 glucan biosynthesis protein G [Methylocella silvestris]